jgi:hypothetical protein
MTRCLYRVMSDMDQALQIKRYRRVGTVALYSELPVSGKQSPRRPLDPPGHKKTGSTYPEVNPVLKLERRTRMRRRLGYQP